MQPETREATGGTRHGMGVREISHGPECQLFIQDLLDEAADMRLPELFSSPHPDAPTTCPTATGLASPPSARPP